jgi:transposase
MISIDIRRRIVRAYQGGLCKTYEETAEMFDVGSASVSRLLRLHRETGDIRPKPIGGNNAQRVDREWLKGHAMQYPDDRLIDRVDAWERVSGRRVTRATMSNAMREIGWTYKKRPPSPTNKNEATSLRSATRL